MKFSHCHLLANRRQQSGESLDEFFQQLRKLSKDCDLRDVTAGQYREELVRDSFINGLSLPPIHQRLLENTNTFIRAGLHSGDLSRSSAEER